MELSVIEEQEQARIQSIRDEASESVLEAAAKHLDAMAKLLLRAKRNLGFPDANASEADLRRALGEAEDIVADIVGHWPMSPTDAVELADFSEMLGGNAECCTIDEVSKSCAFTVESIAKSLAAV